MARKTTLTDREAQQRINDVTYMTQKRKRRQRALRNQEANRAWWDNLNPDHRIAIFKGFDDQVKKKIIARQVGYPYSFIVYVYTHHYLGANQWQ
jgi:hypothetical protein